MEYIKKLLKDKELDEKFTIINKHINNVETLNLEEINLIVETLYKDINFKTKFNTTLFRDLEFFETYDSTSSANTIFNKLNNTNTLGGKYLIEHIIRTPIYDIDILNNRKNSILSISEIFMKKTDINKSQSKELISVIESFDVLKRCEPNINWFLKESDNEFNSVKHLLYFPRIFNFLNNFGLGLTIKNVYKIFLSPVIGIISPITYFIIPYSIIRYKFHLKISFVTYLKQVIRTLIIMYKGSSGSFLSLNTLWIGFSILVYFQNLINSFDLAKLYIQLSRLIVNKINDLSDYTKHTKNISNYIYTKNNIEPYFNYYETINYNDLLLNNKNKRYELLNNFGDKLSIYKNIDIKFIKDLLRQSYSCDAIFSIYILLKKYNLTLPNYLTKSNNPQLKLKNFYHPLLDNSINTIKNSTFLNNRNNMIITGPNAAGKSTFIKSIAVNTILTQSIGLSFSENIIVTPFSYIASQINTYDINGQRSLFQAEMYNIKMILDDIRNNKNNSIVFLDELFNSTNIVEGVAASYSICDMLSKIPSNLTIFATHFLYLCKLSENNKYKNYKFEAICSENNIVFPYKLKKGISSQYIALEILKNNNFDEEIINNSINIKNKILSNLTKKNKKQNKMSLKTKK
jgi:DNA mismatch repair ATPase MutS